MTTTTNQQQDRAGEEQQCCNSVNIGHKFPGTRDNSIDIDYLQKLAKLAQESGSRSREAQAYSNLGMAYYRLGYFEKAIPCFERHLIIANELGDRIREGNACGILGSAHYNLKNFKTALTYNELHLEISKELEDRAREGLVCGDIGVNYCALKDFETAVVYLELQLKIAKEVGNRAEEGRALRNLGQSYNILEDFRKAINFNELGLKIAKELGDRVGEENIYGNLGIAYCNLGDFTKAKEACEQHLKIAKEVRDRAGEGNAYGNLGHVYNSLGDFTKDKYACEQQLKIAKEEGDKIGEGNAYSSLGCTYFTHGYFIKAVDYHERYLQISKELENKLGEGNCYGNLGLVYHDLGDFQTAIGYFKLHLNISRELGNLSGEGRAYGNLGNSYHMLSDFKNAIHFLELSLKIAKQLGAKSGEGSSYGNLGIVYQKLGDFGKAIEYYELQLKIAKQVGDRNEERNGYGSIGQAHCCLGNFESAIYYHELGLEIAKNAEDRQGEAEMLYGLGSAFEAQSIFPQAADYYQSSVKKLNDIRADLQLKDEWKISFRQFSETVYASLWCALLKQGKIVESLIAAEQGRAQALKDLMKAKYSIQQPFVQSDTMEKRIISSPRCMPPNTVFIALGKQEIVFWVSQKENDVRLRRKEIVEKSPVGDVSTFLQSLAEMTCKEIDVRAVVKCEDRSLQLRDETPANDRSDEQTESPSLHLNPTSLKKYYDLIITPIADLIHGNEITLVPEGPLCLVPYAAFMDSNSKYLSESFRIRVVPSLLSLKLITDCPADYHCKTGALLIGDPWVQEVKYQRRKLQQLPFAKKEVEMIGRILNIEPLTGTEATKDAVLQRISSVALVHIAAHGRMDTGEIALAPNPTRESRLPKEKDYLLTMEDVLNARLHARLVVLSCCHSGRGDIKAEGVVGIARAFLGAGARSILVSLWAIDDEATLEFMKHFYQHLVKVKGKCASEALQQAMDSMRESEVFSSVKYWAPFVLIGDDVTLEFEASNQLS